MPKKPSCLLSAVSLSAGIEVLELASDARFIGAGMHWSSAADAPLTALLVTFFMADLHTAMLRIDGERWREERRDSLRLRNECDKSQRDESGREATLGGQKDAWARNTRACSWDGDDSESRVVDDERRVERVGEVDVDRSRGERPIETVRWRSEWRCDTADGERGWGLGNS